MRLCSLDIFDTVLTRRVAEPADLFLLCGERLRDEKILTDITPLEFAVRRIRAEATERTRAPGLEPTFEEIYTRLAKILSWSSQQLASATQIELQAEAESLTTFPKAAALVECARQSSDQLIYLSDMYLPEDFIRDILAREGLLRSTDKIYISNRHRASKTEGALFDIVRRDFPQITWWKHFGDRLHSDLEMPRRAGIEATLKSDATLSEWERKIRGKSLIASAWRSSLAGTMRVARLQCPDAPLDTSRLWALGADIAGPVLTAFTAWVLRSAQQESIRRLYFVSRDGEILLKIARVLCEAWSIPIECRYLYGSRQAWHAAAIKELGDFERRWLLEPDSKLSISTIANRLAIPPETLSDVLPDYSASDVQNSAPLSSDQLLALWTCLCKPPLETLIRSSAAERRRQALGYLRQEGFFDSNRQGIVDIGWRGNMQQSLSSILAGTEYSHPLIGFYFGLVSLLPEDSYRSFWLSATGRMFPQRRARIMEIFTSGTEGSTLGYEEVDGRFQPVLNRQMNTEAMEWGLPDFQRGILSFTSTFAQSTGPADPALDKTIQAACILFTRFCEDPSADQAMLLGSFPHAADQLESCFVRMLDPGLPAADFAKLAWSRKLWDAHPWVEGQLAVQPCWPVAVAARLRRWKQRLRLRQS